MLSTVPVIVRSSPAASAVGVLGMNTTVLITTRKARLALARRARRAKTCAALNVHLEGQSEILTTPLTLCLSAGGRLSKHVGVAQSPVNTEDSMLLLGQPADQKLDGDLGDFVDLTLGVG